jgi:hypothetical protein
MATAKGKQEQTEAEAIAAFGDQAEVVSVTEGTVVIPDMFDEDALRAIASFDDALALTREYLGEIEEADQVLGDGFSVLKQDDKGRLVGVPLILMEWNFYPGDYGSDFVAVRIAARNENGTIGKYILNDGSTGIATMLRRYADRTGKRGGLFVKHGLSVSEYDYCSMCQKAASKCDVPDVHKNSPERLWRPAKTFYLDTSA